jgi:hypothetical protein
MENSKNLLEQLPLDILYLIHDFVEGPVYRPIPELEPYFSPTYALKNPHLVPIATDLVHQLEAELLVTETDLSRPDIAFEAVTPMERLECYARILSKNQSPDAFRLLCYLIKKYNLDDICIKYQLLNTGSKEVIDWAVKELSYKRQELCELLMNPNLYAFELWCKFFGKEGISELTQFKPNYQSMAIRKICSIHTPETLELLEEIITKKIASSRFKEYCPRSAHFFRLHEKYHMKYVSQNILTNPSDETIDFIKANHPDMLNCLELYANPNDKVLDYLLIEAPLKEIPRRKSELRGLLEMLLKNTNPRVEPLILKCLDIWVADESFRTTWSIYSEYEIRYRWSASPFPNVIKKLGQNPLWIEKQALSVNPIDEAFNEAFGDAFAITEDTQFEPCHYMLAENPNPKALSLLIASIDRLYGRTQDYVIEKIFARKDSVEVDRVATEFARKKFIDSIEK